MAVETHPALLAKRNASAVFTWDDRAFQVELDSAGSALSQPLNIAACDYYSFPCVPNVGVYGDDYTPLIPVLLVKLPASLESIARKLPQGLFSHIQEHISASVAKAAAAAGAASEEATPIWTGELFAMIHPKPLPSPCQKFLCNNFDEVNMMYHAWLFGTTPITEDSTITKSLLMGLYSAKNIKPVHQDLKDAGITFEKMDLRTVCLHGMRFSPENAQFQLAAADGDVSVAHFFALAMDDESHRYVISYHIIPLTDEIEESLLAGIRKADSLDEVCQALQAASSASASAQTEFLKLLTA